MNGEQIRALRDRVQEALEGDERILGTGLCVEGGVWYVLVLVEEEVPLPEWLVELGKTEPIRVGRTGRIELD